jgi:hypothetical protein
LQLRSNAADDYSQVFLSAFGFVDKKGNRLLDGHILPGYIGDQKDGN